MYYVQKQAPAGNWTDWLGTEDKAAALRHRDYCNERFDGEVFRAVERVDTVIEE